MNKALKTWANTQAEEDAMNDDHCHLWRQMIAHMREGSLSGMQVLDYGCNQGGFLRMLHGLKPFGQGAGVDIAQASLDEAARQARGVPLEFHLPGWLASQQDRFDVAFSHEVLYLLPDMAAHAADMAHSLKAGGVYYAAIGCHTDNPLWPRWKDVIGAYSNVKVQDYSLDDYAQAFFAAGFSVSARSYAFDDFVPLKRQNAYFPRVRDALDYYSTHKTLFRFQKSRTV